MPNPLYVSFVWHMHQPFYKDTESGQFFLPWVRLHAVKDYLHLAEVMSDFPTIHQTINTVPSLLVQLQDYAEGRAADPALTVSEKESLTRSDKEYLLRSFFSINWDRFVWPNPRYAQLARLREAANGDEELFGDTFWRDLIVWFNLAWVDPSARRRDPRLRALVEKGHSFDRRDTATVLAYHREACARVIPAYRELADRGQLELSTSPFFHPILPLLIDSTSAQQSRPDVLLPDRRFRHPEDARDQLARAMTYHEETFGRPPRGVWPSEGSVSQATIELIGRAPQIQWIATDEHVLERALGLRFDRDGYGHLLSPRALCRPYRVAGVSTAVFFRDQTLSDRIGFAYQYMDSTHAADDLVDRLLQIWQKLNEDKGPHVVSIILDGENCWESYPNNGDDFLRALFTRLSREPRLKTTTPSEFLDLHGVSAEIKTLPSASWIGANFDSWIGEPDQNRAWELVGLVRDRLSAWEKAHGLTDASADVPRSIQNQWERARLALLIAEGSDWFWWYYSRNRFEGENEFDAAFRRHLANVYRAINAPVPGWLGEKISGESLLRAKAFSGSLSLSVLSSAPKAPAEWVNAGFVEPDTSIGTMQTGATVMRRLYFGCDRDNLYFRLETNAEIRDDDLIIFIGSDGDSPVNYLTEGPSEFKRQEHQDGFRWKIAPRSTSTGVSMYRATADGDWEPLPDQIEAAFGEKVVELRVKRTVIGISPDAEIRAAAGATRAGRLVETLPTRGVVSFHFIPVSLDGVPDADHVSTPDVTDGGGRRA